MLKNAWLHRIDYVNGILDTYSLYENIAIKIYYDLTCAVLVCDTVEYCDKLTPWIK